MARLRLRGARLCHRSLHLGVSRGDLGVHPRCSDSPPRFVAERPLRGPCTYLAYGRSTCAELASRVDTKVSHDDTVGWEESRWRDAVVGAGRCRTPGRCGSDGWYAVAGTRLPSTFLASALALACLHACLPADDAAARFGSTHTNLKVRESLRCPPSRRVPHKWSGRRPNRYMGRVSGLPFRTRRTV